MILWLLGKQKDFEGDDVRPSRSLWRVKFPMKAARLVSHVA